MRASVTETAGSRVTFPRTMSARRCVLGLLGLLALAGCGQDDGSVRPAGAQAVSNLAIPPTAFVKSSMPSFRGHRPVLWPQGAEGVVDTAPRCERASALRSSAPRTRRPSTRRSSACSRPCATAIVDSLLPAGTVTEAGMGTVLVEDRLVLTGEFSDPAAARPWLGSLVGNHGNRRHSLRAVAGRSRSAVYRLHDSVRARGRRAAGDAALLVRAPLRARFVFRSPAGTSLTLELPLDRSPFGFGRPAPRDRPRARRDRVRGRQHHDGRRCRSVRG